MKTESIEKHQSLLQEKTTNGTCTLCARESQCTFLSRPHLHECDEFEGLSKNPIGVIETYLSQIARNPKPSHQTNQSLKGLCKTCEIQEGCTFIKADGGVWHCEEFI